MHLRCTQGMQELLQSSTFFYVRVPLLSPYVPENDCSYPHCSRNFFFIIMLGADLWPMNSKWSFVSGHTLHTIHPPFL